METHGPPGNPASVQTWFQPAVVFQLLAFLIGGLLAYGAISGRVAVLEQQAKDGDRRLQSIESKIDVLIRRP